MGAISMNNYGRSRAKSSYLGKASKRVANLLIYCAALKTVNCLDEGHIVAFVFCRVMVALTIWPETACSRTVNSWTYLVWLAYFMHTGQL